MEVKIEIEIIKYNNCLVLPGFTRQGCRWGPSDQQEENHDSLLEPERGREGDHHEDTENILYFISLVKFYPQLVRSMTRQCDSVTGWLSYCGKITGPSDQI